MEYKELYKGKQVTYVPSHTKRIVQSSIAAHYIGRELGVVTSWNESYVFVDYDGSGRGKATRIEDLEEGDQSFYCADEWDSVLDGAFGRCEMRCYNCKNKLFENQLVTNYFINILKIITKKFGSL